MITIPKQPNQFSLPIWDQQNNSDVHGSLWATTGIDLSENEGKLRLGKRICLATGTVDSVDATSYPVAFKTFTDNIGVSNFTIMGNYIFRNYIQGTQALAHITTTSIPTVSSATSDMELFNNELYVAGGGADAKYLTNGGTGWTTISSVGNGSNPVSMCVYASKIYYGSGNTVNSSDASHTAYTSGAFTVTIPDPFLSITFIRASSNRIWIGTVNYNNGKGRVYEWDGAATQVSTFHLLESAGALACVIKDDIPYIMDANGKLLYWNGGTFTELARLNRRRNYILNNATSQTNNRFIHPNGMALLQGKIHCLINGVNSGGAIEETIPSGIYEYDPNRGLVHKFSISTALSGGTIKDYGNTNLSGVGALAEWNGANNGFFAGATYYSDATTVNAGIFYNDPTDVLQKGGSFITTKQYAIDQNGQPSVQNTWQNLYILYKKLLDSGDKIVVKYRVTEVEPIQATITWTGTTTFTVPNSSINVGNYWTAGTGGEIEILNGVGAGKCAHITNAVNNSGTWTVTVDETFTGATGTAIARFQLWTKLGVITQNNPTANGVTYDQEGISMVSNWVQFKIWMLFTGRDELEKLLIINQNFNPAS